MCVFVLFLFVLRILLECLVRLAKKILEFTEIKVEMETETVSESESETETIGTEFSISQNTPMSSTLKYPKHIALIMDGNGRWATQQNKPRYYGHLHGCKNLLDIIATSFQQGSQFLTFYVFSEQNWKRSTKEIHHIFRILHRMLHLTTTDHDFISTTRIIVQGRTDRLPPKLAHILHKLVHKTKNHHTTHHKTLILALDYSGRHEILEACRQFYTHNQISDPLTEETIRPFLGVPIDVPDPDLVIRTGGEQRLSDFLLWQMQYAELYFTKTLWPDFNTQCLEQAVADYAKRQRRFGGVFEEEPLVT